ncbi:helix-turn-helix domain-containing protein [Duganella sp. sic0402]|uniref:AraC family transcriptional regulator n=1 Tax=Duganella sp. sic0402 TaxID=2854786 RepID=UPI001C488A64|nr:helix-turn-helix domain-containing protein [Duganella sp. sic0402]MBV7539182.1 helix-turn-helix domain-containing protein [Duganella sp. sic0402]
MVDTIISWLFLAAIAQAVFLSIALLNPRQPEMRTANRLLSALLLIFSAIIGHAWLGLNQLYRIYPHSALAIVTLGLAVGPLLYLYLHAMLSDQPLGRRALLHFLPFAVATLAMLPFYLRSADEKLAWMRAYDGWPWYLALFAVVKMAILFFYLRASYRLVQRVPADSALVTDLRRLMRVWLFSAGLSVLAVAMAAVDAELPLSVEAVDGGALMLFVFATAYTAMRLPLGYRPQTLPPPKPRYGDKQLSTADRDAFLARLTACMEQQQPYRNGALKLEDLAAQVAMTPHELSQLINQHCDANFADFLNRYRVEALKNALQDPQQASASILDLSLIAGFNSKSAMNRAFKKITGMTPGEFREQAKTAA